MTKTRRKEIDNRKLHDRGNYGGRQSLVAHTFKEQRQAANLSPDEKA